MLVHGESGRHKQTGVSVSFVLAALQAIRVQNRWLTQDVCALLVRQRVIHTGNFIARIACTPAIMTAIVHLMHWLLNLINILFMPMPTCSRLFALAAVVSQHMLLTSVFTVTAPFDRKFISTAAAAATTLQPQNDWLRLSTPTHQHASIFRGMIPKSVFIVHIYGICIYRRDGPTSGSAIWFVTGWCFVRALRSNRE